MSAQAMLWNSALNGVLRRCETENGILEFVTGLLYEGTYVNGAMHGYGQLKWPNGTVYKGDFDRNQLHGDGELLCSNGERYIGRFNRNVFSGKGEYRANGDKEMSLFKSLTKCHSYIGEWHMGIPHGNGVFVSLPENARYEGDIVYGKRHGHGNSRYADQSWYDGHWDSDQRSGYGAMARIIGNTTEFYKGQWENDKAHGFGCCIWLPYILNRNLISFPAQFDCYEGTFRNGFRDGIGIFYYANGARYEGNFVRNLKSGNGMYFYADGRVSYMSYDSDRLCSSVCNDIQRDKEFFFCVYVNDILNGKELEIENAILRCNSQLFSIYKRYTLSSVMYHSDCRHCLSDLSLIYHSNGFERALLSVREAQRREIHKLSLDIHALSDQLNALREENDDRFMRRDAISYREFVEVIVRLLYETEAPRLAKALNERVREGKECVSEMMESIRSSSVQELLCARRAILWNSFLNCDNCGRERNELVSVGSFVRLLKRLGMNSGNWTVMRVMTLLAELQSPFANVKMSRMLEVTLCDRLSFADFEEALVAFVKKSVEDSGEILSCDALAAALEIVIVKLAALEESRLSYGVKCFDRIS